MLDGVIVTVLLNNMNIFYKASSTTMHWVDSRPTFS